LALCAVPASAQLKPKLSRLNPLARETGGGHAPEFNDRVLEITNGRADQLLKGYAAEIAALKTARQEQSAARAAYEEENKKHPARLAEYEKSHAAWTDCQDKYVKPAEAKAKQDVKRSQDEVTGGDQAAFERRMEEVNTRMQAAQAAGDMNEVMRLADSLQQNMGKKTAAVATQASTDMQAANSKCGAEPVRPAPPAPPSEQAPNLDAAGSKAAGLTAEQYAILKERVAPFCRAAATSADGDVRLPGSGTNVYWVYTAAEAAALRERCGALTAAMNANS
jgi:hypothetical protein